MKNVVSGPFHVAIIPDGNRRFAKQLLEAPSKGHQWGVGKMKEVFEWCKGTSIKVLTLYVLSLENLKNRSKEEVDFLLQIARKEIDDILTNKKHFVHQDKIKLDFFGELYQLPKDLQEKIAKVKERTKRYKNFFINMAVAYGGRQEIVDAVKEIGRKVRTGKLEPEQVDEDTVKENLQTNGFTYPDLILRTGGEKRLSNFLLFQSAYSELIFVDTLWPEFTKKQFLGALKEYAQRERRFGK